MSSRILRRLICTSLALMCVARAVPQTATVTEIQPNIPWGGRATAVTVSPTDANTVVAASFSGGLFKSADGGQSWHHVDSFAPSRLWDVQFNPNNSNELVVSVLNDSHTKSFTGVWLSRDGGNTWKQAQLPPCNQPPFGKQIAFGPTPNVFVGTDCGLAASHDDGATWSWAISGASVPSVVSQAGPNFPANPNSVLVDLCDSTLTPRHSTDNGATFSPLPGPNGGCLSIAESPEEPANVLLAATGAGELWELDNLGPSWTKIATIGKGARYTWVRTGPKYPGLGFTLYVHNGSDLSMANCTGPVTGPRCGSLTGWATFPFGAHHDFGGLAVPASNCRNFVAGDGGIEASAGCAGPPWTESNRGFDALQIYRIAGTVHPDHTDLYIAMQDDGIWASPDGGVSWENAILFDGYIVEAPHSSGGPGQPVTGIQGTPWATFQASADLANPTGFQLPPNSGQYPDFYLVGGGNQGAATYLHTDDGCDPPSSSPCLLYVRDANGNWVKQSPALPFKLSGMSRREYVAGPAANPTIYVTTNKLHPDGSWFDGLSKITGIKQPTLTIQPADVGLGALASWGPDDAPAVIPRVVGVDRNNPQHLIAADASTNMMVVSTTGGSSWTPDGQLTNLVMDNGNLLFNAPNVGCQAHAIAFDPSNGQRIFVGTEASGVIATLDGGSTWFRVPGTEKISSVSDFFFDEVRGVVYVASYGRGLWSITGLTAPAKMWVNVTALQRTTLLHRIRVSVTDAATGAPIAGALVEVSNSNTGILEASGTTAANGTVTLRYKPCGLFDPETKKFIPESCDGSVSAQGYPDVSFDAP
jgi:hypothetical protein